MKILKILPVVFLVVIVIGFFSPLFLQGKLPIPADTITGLYYPFRDLYAQQYPNGMPYKNALITDPVRQQYPWRLLVIAAEKNFIFPLWNPYSFAGMPLAGNMQSAPFSPFNILFFVLPFAFTWSSLMFLQQILAGVFLYFYLDNLRINRFACFLGAVTFSFCGFFIAWLEWGTIVQTALWLPLALLAIDKVFIHASNLKFFKEESKNNYAFVIKKVVLWSSIFIFSITAAFFAGHVQTFFYLSGMAVFYFLARWMQYNRDKKILLLFLLLFFCFLLLTVIQWLPALRLIFLSARDVDQLNKWRQTGWFIPWQNLIQFVAPDFFGNPTTLNYWGVWNYGEFIGYVSILPLLMALFALFFRHDKKTLFFGTVFFLALLFALPTGIAVLPFVLHIPFISTAQPTRLLFIIDFCLAVLASFGLDYFLETNKREQIVYPVIFVSFVVLLLWIFVLMSHKFIFALSAADSLVATHNLYLPTTILLAIIILLAVQIFLKEKIPQTVLIILLLLVTVFDLLHFARKFTPFTDPAYLFPQTAVITFLQAHLGDQRIMTTSAQVLPPNFSSMYHLQTVDGYDPLYILRYGELIAASERGKPDITPPFGFNRIITPQQFDSRIIDLLGVKYVLSLSDISSPKLSKVFAEGQTQVYQNDEVTPRTFFVRNILITNNKQDDINQLFNAAVNLQNTATVELQKYQQLLQMTNFTQGKAKITDYHADKVIITTENQKKGFLILTDVYYPSWRAEICDTNEQSCQQAKIYLADYTLRGILVPAGKHTVIFYDSLF